ncbi:hypothetical protein M9Y10_007496 [Tritrichomonas musculus]|uniref:Protein kinase domain-containing protein n=1 Tax=Tritrichomonas musculus TaxID=1915356 RepID=A0ABR2J1H9_9EUKA
MQKDIQLRYQKFLFDINDFKIVQEIESGGFGSVYSVQNLKTDEICAAKVILTHKDEAQYKKMINREIGIMVRSKHPTIVRFIGYSPQDFKGKNNVTIFMELSKKGSLADFLLKLQNGLLEDIYDNTNRQIILVGIARGMMYLHQHQIIHRDLKPGNVLLDDNLHPYITDFGLSKLNESGHSMSQSQQYGTSIYMAPEVFQGIRYNGKADVYSFGILMYEVVTDLIPYPLLQKGKMTPFQFSNKVVNENYRPEFTVPVKKSIQKLIEKCWSKNPDERPTFEEIFKKLAYNLSYSVNEIYNDNQSEEEDEDDNNYYLDDVDVEAVVSYADEISGTIMNEKSQIHSSKLDEIIENLKTENEATKSLVISLKNENEEIKSHITSLKNENETTKSLIISLRTENEAIKSLVNDLKTENAQLKKKLEETNAKCCNEITSLHNENKMLNDKIAETLNKFGLFVQKLNEEKENKNKEIDELKKRVEELKIEKEIKINDKETNDIIDSKNSSNEKKQHDSISINKDKEPIKEDAQTKEKPKSHKDEKKDKKSQSKKDSDKEKRHSSMKEGSSEKNSKKEKKISKEDKKKSSKQEDRDQGLMTVNKFNKLTLKTQQSIISEISKKKFQKQFFKKINNLLLYLMQHAQSDLSSCFEIDQKNNDEVLSKLKDEPQINLLFQAIEMLAISPTFNMIELKNCIDQFENTTIEIKHPSDLYKTTSDIAFYLQQQLKKKVKLTIFMTGTSTTNTFCDRNDINYIIFDSTINSIQPRSFIGCKSLARINIPSSVTTIPESAFEDCSSLKYVIIPNSVTKIAKRAFSGCTSLKQIKIPSSVTLIDAKAFSECTLLTHITIPSSVSSFGDGDSPFCDCSSLEHVIFDNNSSLTSLQERLFMNLSSLTKISIPPSVISIGACCFNQCDSLAEIILPPNLKEIGYCAFGSCKSLREISLPSSLQSIGSYAFENCSSLNQIAIPSSVSKIGNGAFVNCIILKEVTLPSSLSVIETHTFEGCKSLTQISLPLNLQTIELQAFYGCYSLKSVFIPSSVTSLNKDAFPSTVNIIKQ